ncbi:MAG: hypothetical protein Tsb0015_16520 [Simkaniaceae bacterium]
MASQITEKEKVHQQDAHYHPQRRNSEDDKVRILAKEIEKRGGGAIKLRSEKFTKETPPYLRTNSEKSFYSSSSGSSNTSEGSVSVSVRLPEEEECKMEGLSSESSNKLYQETLTKALQAWNSFYTVMSKHSIGELPEGQVKKMLNHQKNLSIYTEALLAFQGISNLPDRPKKDSLPNGREVNFVSGLHSKNEDLKGDMSASQYESLNTILNNFFVLDSITATKGLMSDRNKKNFKLVFEKNQYSSFLREWKTTEKLPLERAQLEVKILCNYKKRILQLLDPKLSLKTDFMHHLEHEIKRKKISFGLFDSELSHIIESCYLNKIFNDEIQESIRHVIKALKSLDVGPEETPLNYASLVAKLKEQLIHGKPGGTALDEWRRAIGGGYLSVVDEKGEFLLAPCQPKKPGESDKEFEKRLDIWADKITRIISLGMFDNSNLLDVCFTAIKRELNLLFPKEPRFEGSGLAMHERIFNKLRENETNLQVMGNIVQGVDSELKKKFPKMEISGQEVLQHINEFYRITMQCLTVEAARTLDFLYQKSFNESSLIKFKSPMELSGNEINQIKIMFVKGAACLDVLKLGFIKKSQDQIDVDTQYQFMQRIKILIPKPGFHTPESPVGVEYFYYIPEDSPDTVKNFLDNFKLLAVGSGFSSIKSVKSPF